MIFRGSGPVLLRNPIFSGGMGGPCPPSGFAHGIKRRLPFINLHKTPFLKEFV